MDFYVLLGLERSASLAEIKRAYRRLARKYHPDINPGDRAAEAFFRQLVEAYETLSDPDRRRSYDVRGKVVEAAARHTFEFEGFDFSVVLEPHRDSTFGDLFADVFRRQASDPGRRENGADLHAALSLDFAEAMRGGERTVTVTRLETCAVCGGAGLQRATDARCGHCRGAGAFRCARGHMVFTKPCPHCGGSGRLRQKVCPACSGEGASARSENVTVHVPAGVADGGRIRVAGKGNVGRGGGSPGDLFITTHVAPHAWFQRHGDDLHATIPVAIHEAALGAKIDVPTLDGAATLRIPPGTQAGQRFRLRAHGAPSPQTGARGDLVVEVRLVLPRLADERSKELMREFGRLNSENVRKDFGV
jgi:molecular chaperone DnaJ